MCALSILIFLAVSVVKISDKDSISMPIPAKLWRWLFEQLDSLMRESQHFDDDEASKKGLNIKVFPDYSEEWAEFVVMNRKNNSDVPAHPYDIVIGPIADDTVGVQIRRYIMGYISAFALVKELRFKGDHAVQYFFGTPKAVELLKRIEL